MSAPQSPLIPPRIVAPGGYPSTLASWLAAEPFAAVVLRAAGGDEALARAAKALGPTIQKAGAALLLDAPVDARTVARCGADGAQFPFGSKVLVEGIESLKPDRIVGVCGLRSRHEAMDAGEMAVDYILFGEPRADGSLPETDRTVERAEWWAEIFNMPCVAYAHDLVSVPVLAATGAEFLALGPWIFEADDPAALVREARRLASRKL